MSRWTISRFVWFVAVGSASACTGRATTPAQTGSGGNDANSDPDPVITAEARAAFSELSPTPLPAPPPDVTNRVADDANAAVLGRRFFFDKLFSGALLDGDNDGSVHALGKKGDTGKVSCSGCHLPESGFSDTRTIREQTSLAAGWGIRRAPSLLDVGQSRVLMWDGRRDAMFNQVFGPFESEVEMNGSRLFVAEQVFARYRADYEAVFGPLPPLGDTVRFPVLDATTIGCTKLDSNRNCTTHTRGTPGDGAQFDGLADADRDAVTRVVVNVGKAIGAYERLLTCGPGRFDRWVHGDASALSRAEQRGATLFVGKAHCVDCHKGPFLSDEKFHNVGLKPSAVATVFLDIDDQGAGKGLPLAKADPLNVQGTYSDGDDGRVPATVTPDFDGAFRTPRLRCSSKRPSFMHTAQLQTLSDVVTFFNLGGDPYGFIGKSEIAALNLSPRETADLVAFLESLDGPGPSAELLAPPP